MISSFDGQIFNDSRPFVDYIVKDLVDGQHHFIKIDEFGDIYTEITTLPVSAHDIIDDLNGAWYGLFVYNSQVHVAPVKTHDGDTLYATDCFISVGSTINLKIQRTTDTPTSVGDIEISIFSHELEEFLNLDISIFETSVNYFLAPFVIPLAGDFLIVIKTPTSFIGKNISVQRFSYEELIHEIEKEKEKSILNKNNHEAFI